MREQLVNPAELEDVVEVFRLDPKEVKRIDDVATTHDITIQTQSMLMTEARKRPPRALLSSGKRKIRARPEVIAPWTATAFAKGIRSQRQNFNFGVIPLVADDFDNAMELELARGGLEVHVQRSGKHNWAFQIDGAYVYGPRTLLLIDDERGPIPGRDHKLRLMSFGAVVTPLLETLDDLQKINVEASRQNSTLKVAELDVVSKSLKDLETGEGQNGVSSAIMESDVPVELQINGVLEDAIRQVLEDETGGMASELAVIRAANTLGIRASAMWQKVMQHIKTVVPETWQKIRVPAGRTLIPLPGVDPVHEYIQIVEQIQMRINSVLGIPTSMLGRSKQTVVAAAMLETERLEAAVQVLRNNIEEAMHAFYDLELGAMDRAWNARFEEISGFAPIPLTIKFDWGGSRVRSLEDLKMAVEIDESIKEHPDFKTWLMQALGVE